MSIFAKIKNNKWLLAGTTSSIYFEFCNELGDTDSCNTKFVDRHGAADFITFASSNKHVVMNMNGKLKFILVVTQIKSACNSL